MKKTTHIVLNTLPGFKKMSEKWGKSLKTVFLKITNFYNISENHTNKPRVSSQNVNVCPNYVKMCFIDRVLSQLFEKYKKYLHVHFFNKNMGITPTDRDTFAPPPLRSRPPIFDLVGVLLSQIAKIDPRLRLGLRRRFARKNTELVTVFETQDFVLRFFSFHSLTL